MLETHERWDVVVVGGRGADNVELAAKLARYSGLPSREIQHALLLGSVRVHSALSREAADAAVQALDELGARAQLQPFDEAQAALPGRAAANPPTPPGVLPPLEPDPEAASTSAKPIAPPPPFADPEASAPGPVASVPVDTSRVQGRPEQSLERPFERDSARPRSAASLTEASPPDRPTVDPNRVTAKEGELDQIAMRVAQGLSAARRARPDPTVARQPARAGEIDSGGAGDRPVLPRSLHPRPAEASQSARPSAPPPAGATAQPSPAAAALELDLDAVRFGSASSSARAAQARLTAASSAAMASQRSASSLSAAATGAGSAPSMYAPGGDTSHAFAPAPGQPRRLLGRDPVAALILGFVIGTAAGILMALMVTRWMIDDDVRPLETELAAAAHSAEAIDRTVDELRTELDEALAAVRMRFFMVWAATALPIGLLLGRMRLG